MTDNVIEGYCCNGHTQQLFRDGLRPPESDDFETNSDNMKRLWACEEHMFCEAVSRDEVNMSSVCRCINCDGSLVIPDAWWRSNLSYQQMRQDRLAKVPFCPELVYRVP